VANSAQLRNMPEPDPHQGTVLVDTIAIGVCGTDREIIEGQYGQAPPGQQYLIHGHESLGRVQDAPADSGLGKGDLVVGIVRRPDPVPCPNCRVGEWDMCRNGQYTEHGIKGLHGFCAERFRENPDHIVKLDASLERVGVLMEPTTILAKAWEQIERIGRRSNWSPQRVLVTGAGPIGLMAALMGRQRRLDVQVFDRLTQGPKPQLVRDLGATYHSGDVKDLSTNADIIIECTGYGPLVLDVMEHNRAQAIVCLTGLSSGRRIIPFAPAQLNKKMVLENDVVFGSVNANRRHYEQAAQVLAQADRAWLEQVIARRVPLDRWQEALEHRPGDVKTVIDLTLR
jgi:threonine dehydrogenase-like Zn-dependent dehydrogenase